MGRNGVFDDEAERAAELELTGTSGSETEEEEGR
jgi:hypothetical protein